MNETRFTDGRVPESGMRPLFTDEYRWQRWLDVEVALAKAEAGVGIVPAEAVTVIASVANVALLGPDNIRDGIRRTGHKLMAIVSLMSDLAGDPYGGWIHWGATTQNITQTGDMLVLREAHGIILGQLAETFAAMASLADRGQDMVCAGRTHGQHAVPIVFGFKVAGWIDEFARHIDRLHEVEPRVLTVMIGGAVGNFASLGEKGPIVQDKMAEILDLQPMRVPMRSTHDAQAEYVCVLGLLASTAGKVAKEIATLMQTEFGEVCEPIPDGTVGSSTMPHKRNPQLTDDCMVIAAELRSLVPLAMEGMLHDHEVNEANAQIIDVVTRRACVLMGDLLTRLNFILKGLIIDPNRMRENLELTGGLTASEAVMLALGEHIGRQKAHEVIYEDARKANSSKLTFKEVLMSDERVTEYLDATAVDSLLNPETKIGLSSVMAREAAVRAHEMVQTLQNTERKAGCRAKSTDVIIGL